MNANCLAISGLGDVNVMWGAGAVAGVMVMPKILTVELTSEQQVEVRRRLAGRGLSGNERRRLECLRLLDRGLSLVFNLGRSPDLLILVRTRDSRAAVLHASRYRATSREVTAAGEVSRR